MRRLALLLVLLAGCAAAPPLPVFIANDEEKTSGQGAAVGEWLVLTLEHVVGNSSQVRVSYGGAWHRARVVHRFSRELCAEEGFVLLRVDPPLVAIGGPPAWLQLARARRGDSGTPLLDSRGRLLGLVTGKRPGAIFVTPVPEAAREAVR